MKSKFTKYLKFYEIGDCYIQKINKIIYKRLYKYENDILTIIIEKLQNKKDNNKKVMKKLKMILL